MKKITAICLALVLLIFPFGIGVTPHRGIASEENTVVYGDVSQDGTVSAEDALMVLQSVVGKIDLTEHQQDVARVTAETGAPDASDALEMLQYVVGKIQVFSRFGEAVTVEKLYQIPNAKGSGASYSFVDLIETYEQYTDLIQHKNWQAEDLYTNTYFETKSLLVFNSTTYYESTEVTILSAKREYDTLLLEIEEHYYGAAKDYPQNRWYGVQIQKLQHSPDFFQIEGIESAEHQTVVTHQTYRLPNVKHGMLTKLEVGTMNRNDLPPAEIAAYWADGGLSIRDILKMQGVEISHYKKLHFRTYDRFVPIVVPVSFANLGCTAQLGDYQIDADGSLTLDVTLEMRLGAEAEQNSVYVLWLEYDRLVEQGCLMGEGTNWLSVTVKHYDENNQPTGTDKHYYKPFWSMHKTTAINNVSFEMVEADCLKLTTPFAPFEDAAICHSYEEYVAVLEQRFIDQGVPEEHKQRYYNMLFKSNFDDGRALVIMSSVWNVSGHRLTPVAIGMNSLFGDTLYLGMELYSDQSDMTYQEEQHNLCFVWVNGSLNDVTKLSVDTRYITERADEIETQTVHQDFVLDDTE